MTLLDFPAFIQNAVFVCLKNKNLDCKRTKEIKKQVEEWFLTARNLALLK